MASADFEVKGVEKLIRAMQELDRKFASKIIPKGLRAAAKMVQEQAKANAPVDSGALKRSIRVRAMKKRPRGTYGMRVTTSNSDNLFTGEQFYGAFQEFGTHNESGGWAIEPKAYMRRAFESKQDEAKAAALRIYKEGIESLGNK